MLMICDHTRVLLGMSIPTMLIPGDSGHPSIREDGEDVITL